MDWLESESRRLGLDNVTVVRARAEDAHLPDGLDQVTARAVSALSKLIPLTVGLLRHGGELIFMKGARVEEELAAGQLEGVRAWLGEHVHRHGRTLEPDEVLRAATGSELDPEPMLRFLAAKYGDLYDL